MGFKRARDSDNFSSVETSNSPRHPFLLQRGCQFRRAVANRPAVDVHGSAVVSTRGTQKKGHNLKPKVFVTRPLPQRAIDLLAAQCAVQVHPSDSALKPPQLGEACRDVEGLLAVGVRVSEEVLSQAAKLRVVANCGVGYDNIDVAACSRRKIVVTNTPGVLTDTTADLAFALLMAAARRVVEADRFVREGHWQRWEFGMLWGADIHNKTLGIWGFGRIGQALARRGRGFDMKILYHSRRRSDETLERELEACYVDRDTLLRESDFLSLHVPMTPETHHLIGADELRLMKPSAFLINTARGKVIDEEALVTALKAKAIAGAGLDVFEHEPHLPPDLAKLENVVLLPHVGSATGETRLAMAMLAADNLLAALEGRRPPNVVNAEVFD
ncbi:MAG: D-glycerate dehydrogenase [Acidobacteriia bacterium]|nr:D-glycerate dehydrogenase [Terriglobia bacterium]